MKRIHNCKECHARFTMEVKGSEKLFDLRFDWACPVCKKINNEIIEIWSDV